MQSMASAWSQLSPLWQTRGHSGSSRWGGAGTGRSVLRANTPPIAATASAHVTNRFAGLVSDFSGIPCIPLVVARLMPWGAGFRDRQTEVNDALSYSIATEVGYSVTLHATGCRDAPVRLSPGHRAPPAPLTP
jgi:hypothetical protein